MTTPSHVDWPTVDVDAWVRRFDLLADPTRLRLLMHMHLYPDAAVGRLAQAAGITPTAASQALRVLREQGWVRAEREGRSVRYALVDDAAHALLHHIGHLGEPDSARDHRH